MSRKARKFKAFFRPKLVDLQKNMAQWPPPPKYAPVHTYAHTQSNTHVDECYQIHNKIGLSPKGQASVEITYIS